MVLATVASLKVLIDGRGEIECLKLEVPPQAFTAVCTFSYRVLRVHINPAFLSTLYNTKIIYFFVSLSLHKR